MGKYEMENNKKIFETTSHQPARFLVDLGQSGAGDLF